MRCVILLRSVRRTLVATGLGLAALLACGERAPAPSAEPWPLVLDEPGVLGYAAARLDAAQQAELFELGLGWVPEGLSADRPLVAVRLDSKTFGGPVGLILPLQDEGAFLASVDECPLLTPLGRDRYQVDVPIDTGLGRLMMFSSAWQAGSPMSILRALEELGSAGAVLEIRVDGRRALAVPSFEAHGVCRRFMRRTDDFSRAPPAAVVISMDLDRLRIVHAEELRNLDQQLKGLVGGMGVGGMLGGMLAGASPEIPMNWEVLWALKDMLDLEHFNAAQIQLDPVGEVTRAAAGTRREGAALAGVPMLPLGARVRLDPASRLLPMLQALRAAPELQDGVLVVAADSERFAQAAAEWFRPLGEVVKGRGSPCDRYLAELAGLLGGWGGRAAVVGLDDGGVVTLLSVRPGAVADPAAWREWLDPLLRTARIEGFDQGWELRELEAGRSAVVSPGGEVLMTIGGYGPEIVWLMPGEAAGPPDRVITRFEQASAAPDETAGLRALVPGFAIEVGLVGDELHVQAWDPARRP
jgi:hypothetical protein